MNSVQANTNMIAPCGINCSLCLGFLREKNRCQGCRSGVYKMSKHLTSCRIKFCEHLKGKASGFCYECSKFPCTRIRSLDKRYSTRYHVSIMENFAIIRNEGVEKLIEKDRTKWQCHTCGGTICMHKGFCLKCGN